MHGALEGRWRAERFRRPLRVAWRVDLRADERGAEDQDRQRADCGLGAAGPPLGTGDPGFLFHSRFRVPQGNEKSLRDLCEVPVVTMKSWL